jgi:small subunit ribosomal protein S4
MKIGPKFKIARRLGSHIFEKTQGPKFALSQARKEKTGKGFSRPKSEFAIQLLEKQKARFTYGLSEKQFSRYAKEALAKKDTGAVSRLYSSLELRADNVAYRAGLAPTRLAGRQMASHGHLTLNGKRITIPSIKLKEGDVLGVRAGSVEKPLFAAVEEKAAGRATPSWITFDAKTKSVTVVGSPNYASQESPFDLNAVLEFYSR